MKRFLILCIFIVVALGGVAALWWSNGTSAVNPADTATKKFEVRPGAGVKEIAGNLISQGLIKDAQLFYIVVKVYGLENKIQAGEFYLSPSMSSVEIARALQFGSEDIIVTITEGKRAQEIADILAKNLPTYDDSWRGILNMNEGYLFPDTYAFTKDATIEEVVSKMRGNFEKKYSSIPNLNRTKLSQEQIVILASMIEREARHDEDRPMVASVLLNRLEINMALQIDATVQYALGYNDAEQTWWKKGITLADLDIKSPYNTYEYPGLPPGPIANPGLEALTAVVNPANTDFIYYISDPKTGQNIYAKDLKGHHANIKKYGLE